MSGREHAADWIQSLHAFLQKARILDNAVMRDIAKATPLMLVTLLKPELVDVVYAFRSARRSLLGNGGNLVRELYWLHRNKLMGGLRDLPGEVKEAVRVEILAHERFIRDLRAFEAVPTSRAAAGAAQAALSEADVALERAWRESIVMDDSPMAEPLKIALRTFLRVVTPQHEASWKTFIDMATKSAGRLDPRLKDLSYPELLANPSFRGHVTTLHGEMFEHFGRYSSQLTDLYDVFLRSAAARAGILGEGWEPLRSFGQLRLAVVERSGVLAAIQRGPISPQSFTGWLQFADDSVLAVKRSQGKGLGEAEINSFFQFKAEAGETDLLVQRVNDYRRVMRAEQDKTVLVAIGDEVFQLRPISGEEVTTFVSVATWNTHISRDATLSGMGVDVMHKNLSITRDEIRELAESLLWEAFKAL